MSQHIVIAGAGSIGCYVGGALGLGARQISFLARPRIADELRQHGLHLTDYEGRNRRLDASKIKVFTEPADILPQADVILVTVKSGATAEIAHTIAQHAKRGARVVSLQNGVENADILKQTIQQQQVLAGMVPYNVVAMGEGRFHRGTEGDLIIEAGVPGLADSLSVQGSECVAESDMKSVMWGKLLLNLNNALNALSDLPLKTQLEQRQWRMILAASQSEALTAMAAAGIRPKQLAKLPPSMIPWILRLPDPLFKVIAGAMLKIDPEARSSMWEDLKIGRLTEIDQLQGAVIRLGERSGVPTPINERVLAAVRLAEAAKSGSPRLSPDHFRH